MRNQIEYTRGKILRGLYTHDKGMTQEQLYEFVGAEMDVAKFAEMLKAMTEEELVAYDEKTGLYRA